MNVSDLRTEIKCWERDFRNEHGRDPKVQDIRERPHIADKYKLYKKLSKAKPSAHADPPSTPPKPQPKSLMSKSRAVKTQAPAISNNPFSPVKNGSKHKQIKHDDPHGVPNPFATPVKNVQAYREASPDPFPLVLPSQIASSSQLILAPPRNSAISKARKRLRGEPVSPSPVKIKRQRVASQISLQLTHDNGGTFGGDDDTTDEDTAAANSSFVADSPVKAPAGSKSFMSLFTENPNTVLDKPVGSKRTLSRGDRAGLADRALSMFSDDDTGTAGLFGSQITQTTRSKKTGRIQNQQPSLSKGFAPSQSNATRHVRKRSPSDSEMDDASAAEPKAPTLIPPSPPPVSSTQNNRYDIRAKHMVKGKNNRKKPKISAKPDDEAEDEDSQEGEEEKVKVVDWRLNRRKDNEEQEFWDDDEPLFRKRRRPSEENSGADPNTLEGDFTVNVPHDLLQVLAISPSKSGRPQEDRIVRALLHGTRAGHYDGNRGGHIWDVGETEGDEDTLTERWRGEGEEGMHGSNAVDEGDDDEWEGEAVPWQVAEL